MKMRMICRKIIRSTKGNITLLRKSECFQCHRHFIYRRYTTFIRSLLIQKEKKENFFFEEKFCENYSTTVEKENTKKN